MEISQFTNKEDEVAEWIKEQVLIVCCPQETYFICKNTYRLRVGGKKSVYQANGNWPGWSESWQSGLQTKANQKDKSTPTSTKETDPQEDIIIIYAQEVEAFNFTKQVLMDIKMTDTS